MASKRAALLANMSLEQLADYHATRRPGSEDEQAVTAEYTLRQLQMQREAADAAREAADAAIETAHYNRRNARYLMWSVIVLAASAFLSLVVTITGFHL
jgi:hypothetical protein